MGALLLLLRVGMLCALHRMGLDRWFPNGRRRAASAEAALGDRLGKSIAGTVASLLALQCALYSAFAFFAHPSDPSLPRGFLSSDGPAFFLSAFLFHAVILGMLFVFKQDFVKEPSGERLGYVNLANRITLVRLSTLPTLLFLVIAAKDYRIRYPLLVLVVLVFATDFADGYVSRTAGEVTRIGRMMDSASDYVLLVVLSIVFYYFDLVPLWLFVLVTSRLGLQALFMYILRIVKKRIEPRTTFMGKAAVASIMVLYAIEVLRLILGLQRSVPFVVLEWVTGAVVLASVGDKVAVFAGEISGRQRPGLVGGQAPANPTQE